jgi:hypothetical protein
MIYQPVWLNSHLKLPRDRDTIQSWCKHFFAPNFLHIEPPEPEPEPPPEWAVLGLLREIKLGNFIGLAIA